MCPLNNPQGFLKSYEQPFFLRVIANMQRKMRLLANSDAGKPPAFLKSCSKPTEYYGDKWIVLKHVATNK
jgi:hypothetical protein